MCLTGCLEKFNFLFIRSNQHDNNQCSGSRMKNEYVNEEYVNEESIKASPNWILIMTRAKDLI